MDKLVEIIRNRIMI